MEKYNISVPWCAIGRKLVKCERGYTLWKNKLQKPCIKY